VFSQNISTNPRQIKWPWVKTNLPSFARVFVTEQPGRRIVHVLSYMPELRGEKTQIIEEPLQINDVAIALRCDGMKPVHARLEPEGKELEMTNHDGYTQVTIPRMSGHALVVVQYSETDKHSRKSQS